MSRAFRVTVPASTANLGSGFDALGLSLARYDEITVEVVAGATGDVQVEVDGEGAGEVATGHRHLVVKLLHRTMRHFGVQPPSLRVRCANRIPHSRGLGSSAAAIVAGITAGCELSGVSVRDETVRQDALNLAASFEGHADNVAASLLGGFVIAWNDAERFHASRLEPHPDLAPVMLVPAEKSATRTTRGLLPEAVPHRDAAFAAGRAALAVHAFTSDPGVLLAATADRLHQDYRERAWPASVAVIKALREAGVPAAVSGAGPTVLTFPGGGALPETVDSDGFEVHPVPVDRGGVQVAELG
ncbi:homoserine kinase [Allosaccharopolyspora coralli]|uniref:homoserine kinase n=1 Tax=Allosaccharopolyspora coralli TaxID=2665642 RepID=UPI001E5C147C|nr:homoserine kinase [Allosaccharopolyspora coralli]